jgi:hypothetical protein
MDKTNKAMSEALGIEYIEPTKHEILVPEGSTEIEKVSEGSSDAHEDYVLARNTFRSLIEQGNDAMEQMTIIAKESESPRAYEVFATMMKTISETTKDLYDLQMKSKELKGGKQESSEGGDINIEKAVFVGTATELLQQIKKKS